MPIGFLSDAERERLDSFPAQVVPGDIETYFTLSRADRRQIPRTASPANRLGFAGGMSLAQLKILQEVITLAVFVPFAMLYMGEGLKWNYLWAALCMVGAVYFIFLG